jgi:hypothetical protein
MDQAITASKLSDEKFCSDCGSDIKIMKILFSGLMAIVFLSGHPAHAADSAQIQQAMQKARVPMLCEKFFRAMSRSESLSKSTRSQLREHSDRLLATATDELDA